MNQGDAAETSRRSIPGRVCYSLLDRTVGRRFPSFKGV